MAISVSGSAANNYAAITNAMYQDWLTRFYPQQQQLLTQTQNGQLLKEQLNRVEANFASAQQGAQQADLNQLARYGVQATTNPNFQTRQSLAQITTKNSLRDNEQERAMSVLSGGGKNPLSQLKLG
ncbi:hypothetical protein [Vibrio misgurnus]|uniref:hypothetical protein n=1 Tax=Vibrio misgurnus TaxID=2993714 RepID=UPI0023F9C891|nr:hypothetical protein [Vibrio sp. VCS]